MNTATNGTAVHPGDTEVGEVDALGGQHPEHVVIRDDEKLRGVRERDVLGEDLGFHVAVHADEREGLRLAVDLPGDLSLLGGRRQRTVGVQFEKGHG